MASGFLDDWFTNLMLTIFCHSKTSNGVFCIPMTLVVQLWADLLYLTSNSVCLVFISDLTRPQCNMEWSQILILLAACLTVEGGNCDTALQKLNSQPTDAVTAYMYEHVNCEGEVLTVKKGDQISVMPDGWNDKVSSLVVREDCGLSVYVHRGMTVSHL